MSEESLKPTRRRGRPPGNPFALKEEPMEAPPLTIDEPEFLAEIDALVESGLLEEVTEKDQAELAQMYADAQEEAAEPEPLHPAFAGKPTRNKFVDVNGGLYLPVRQRIVWMRGEPEPHPDWSVYTNIESFEAGTYISQKSVWMRGAFQDVPDVKGGYAVVKARVATPDGVVVGEGTAMERSEVFWDYVEKAETSAIGRALAVAGYGTESAIDLDEGADQGNVSDAPVNVRPGILNPSGPLGEITIEPSAIPGVRQGGRQAKATTPQIAAIRTRAGELMLSPSRLQQIIRDALPELKEEFPEFYSDDVDNTPDGTNLVLGFLTQLSFADCGKVVLALQP